MSRGPAGRTPTDRRPHGPGAADGSFAAAVDRVLAALGPGEIATYGEVAEEAGFPGRARAVGALLAASGGRYPWWRVVTAQGRLVPGLEEEHAGRLRAEGHTVVGHHLRVGTRPASRADRPRAARRPGERDPAERFDRAYFDHWYRRRGFGSPVRLNRKVDHALGTAEYLLDRPVRSVLDVGCGEGAWSGALSRRRPRASYLGVDPSAYAVERYGRSRHLRQGRLGTLEQVLASDEGPFDLVVCVDVLGYAGDGEVQAGLAAIARRLTGVALIETYTSEDEIVGDVESLARRSPATYRRWFRRAGLHRVGPHLYASAALLPRLTTFERPLDP